MPKALVLDSAKVLISNVTEKFVQFLLLIIFAHYLTPEEYGLYSLANSFVVGVTLIYMFASDANLNVNFFYVDEDKKNHLISNLISFSALNFVFILVLINIFYSSILFHIIPMQRLSLNLLALYAYFRGFYAFYLSWLLIREERNQFSLFKIIKSLLEIIIFLVFIFYIEKSWHGFYVSSGSILLLSFIFGVFALHQFYQKFNFSFDSSEYNKFLSYGVAILPHSLTMWLINSSDRFIINYFYNEKNTGLYSAIYSLGMISVVFITSINQVIKPKLFAALKANQKNIGLKRYIAIYVLVLFIFSTIMHLLAAQIVDLFLSDEYLKLVDIFRVVIWSYFFYGVYVGFTNFLFFYKRNITLSTITILCGITNISLNFIFLPKMGIIGAAWATIASFALMALLNIIFSALTLRQERAA